MVREIIDDDHTTFLAEDFGAAAHVLEASKRISNVIPPNSPGVSCDDHCQAVEEIKVTDEGRFKFSPVPAFTRNRKRAQVAGEVHLANAPLRFLAGTESFELGKEPLTHGSHDLAHVRAIPTSNQTPVPRNEIHESAKRQLHRREIVVNVGMIKLDVVYYRDLREVVHKLRTFVEIRGIVFVPFNDEEVTRCNAKAHAEVLRYPANQKSRIESTLIQHPGGNACACCLAMSAGYDERATAAD